MHELVLHAHTSRHGHAHTRFLIESVADLHNALRSRLKSDLVVAHGRPEHVIAAIVRQLHAQQFHVDSVVYQKEISAEEVAVEQAVERACTRVQPSLRMRAEWGSTLYHRDDLPFGASGGKGDIGQLPAVFSQFRKAVETQCSVREALSAPKSMAPMPGGPFLDTLFQVATTADGNAASSFTAVPLDDWLRAVQCTPDPRGIALPGGETHALARLNHYLFESNAIATYKDTRNGLIGMDYSSKFSAYLAHGCLSPREIYHAIQRYTAAPSQSPPTDGPYWMTFEIIWRDFFKFVAIQHGHRLFMRSGFCRVVDRPWSQNAIQFEQWRTGKTGVPWVDAGMRELAATGCLSNRMRQNVASFLTHSLGIDWRLGAAWFESVLVDHDVEVNYGNWQYVAGVGNDPRGMQACQQVARVRVP